jgi:hypothetical protein
MADKPAQFRFIFPAEIEHLDDLRLARLKRRRDKLTAARPALLKRQAKRLKQRAKTRARRHAALVIKRAEQRENKAARLEVERRARMLAARKACEARIHSAAVQAPNSQERTRLLQLLPDWNELPCIDKTGRRTTSQDAARLHRSQDKSPVPAVALEDLYRQFVEGP